MTHFELIDGEMHVENVPISTIAQAVGTPVYAYSAARLVKARTTDLVSYDELSDLLRRCGDREKDVFTRLSKIKWP